MSTGTPTTPQFNAEESRTLETIREIYNDVGDLMRSDLNVLKKISAIDGYQDASIDELIDRADIDPKLLFQLLLIDRLTIDTHQTINSTRDSVTRNMNILPATPSTAEGLGLITEFARNYEEELYAIRHAFFESIGIHLGKNRKSSIVLFNDHVNLAVRGKLYPIDPKSDKFAYTAIRKGDPKKRNEAIQMVHKQFGKNINMALKTAKIAKLWNMQEIGLGLNKLLGSTYDLNNNIKGAIEIHKSKGQNALKRMWGNMKIDQYLGNVRRDSKIIMEITYLLEAAMEHESNVDEIFNTMIPDIPILEAYLRRVSNEAERRYFTPILRRATNNQNQELLLGQNHEDESVETDEILDIVLIEEPINADEASSNTINDSADTTIQPSAIDQNEVETIDIGKAKNDSLQEDLFLDENKQSHDVLEYEHPEEAQTSVEEIIIELRNQNENIEMMLIEMTRMILEQNMTTKRDIQKIMKKIKKLSKKIKKMESNTKD